jgi:hypothetical protein
VLEFSSLKQRTLIENLISDPDLFSVCSPIIKPDYFAPEFRPAMSFVMDYYNKYSNIPTERIIEAETECELTIRNRVTNDEFEYTAQSIASFCRQQAVLTEVLNANKLIESGDYGTLVERMTTAVQISLISDLGTDVLANVAERMEKRKQQGKPYSTGWTNVDETLGGGIKKSEFILFSANSGGGKSIALSNLALSFVKQGLNVLFISLELQEDMIADRFETMITKWDRATKAVRVADTADLVEHVKETHNASIYVKYMEPEVTNANAIKAYLKEFELRHGFLPDALVVDYLDIFGTNERMTFSNVSEKDKISSTQLRAIGNNPAHYMIMATASQQNRDAVQKTEVNQSHIAGGLSKVNIADVYISIVMSDSMRAQGAASFSFLKTRSSSGVGTSVPMNWDAVALLFTSANGPLTITKENPKPATIFNRSKDVNDLDDLLNM